MFAHKSDKLCHLSPSNLTCFVHGYDGVFRQFALQEKTSHGHWRKESGLLHLDDLLSLRCENDNASTRLLKLLRQFAKNETLACACATPKQRNRIRRFE